MSTRFVTSAFDSRLPAGWDHARAHAALRAWLVEAGEAPAACLFADVTASAEAIAFDAPAIGVRATYESLDDTARAALRAELGRLASILRRAASLRAARDPARAASLVDLVAGALEIPSFAHVVAWAAPGEKGRPVLLGWGLLPSGTPTALRLITRLDDGRPPVFVRTVPRRALALALLALVAVGALAALLGPRLLRAAAAPDLACTAEPGQMAAMSELLKEEERERGLRRRLAALEIELGTRRAACPLPDPPPPLPSPPQAPPPATPSPPAVRPPPASTPAPPPRPRSDDQRRARERGGREGQLEIVLAWSSRRDLDLLVTCPSGETIHARTPRACGGALDIDANGSGNARIDDPVEHIVFANPPMGSFRVAVANCEGSGGAEPYRVTVIYQGQVIRQTSGAAQVTRFGLFFGQGCGTPQAAVEFRLPP